jgi:hypothetical protein
VILLCYALLVCKPQFVLADLLLLITVTHAVESLSRPFSPQLTARSKVDVILQSCILSYCSNRVYMFMVQQNTLDGWSIRAGAVTHLRSPDYSINELTNQLPIHPPIDKLNRLTTQPMN